MHAISFLFRFGCLPCCGLLLPLLAQTPPGAYFTFQVPGANESYANAINAHGDITGGYLSGPNGTGAFIRDTNGKFSLFQAPESGAYARGVSINRAGLVVGYSLEPNGILKGFLRHPGGAIEALHPAQGDIESSPTSINEAGIITGWYTDTNEPTRSGFLRRPGGRYSLFHVAGAPTSPRSINDDGWITGDVALAPVSGFLRAPGGAVTLFTVPGCLATFPVAINNAGQVTGYCTSDSGNKGFLREPNGSLTFIAPPGASSTTPRSINHQGVVVGSFYDATGSHGFRRDPGGSIAILDFPNQFATEPRSINEAGTVVGMYRNAVSWLNPFVYDAARPDARILELISIVNGMSLPADVALTLKAPLESALKAVTVYVACWQMLRFTQEVDAMTGTSLTTGQAQLLLENAAGIRVSLGCR